ncbi:hypothetical protein [Sorangium sp. So ce124]|uniref:hypothetical protein n=1 Tax=Sorangium sp. So ce124 TaxID=3133280 RepID=UPI003F5E4E0E
MNRTAGLSAGFCAAGAVAAAVLPTRASGIYAAAMLGSLATAIQLWRRESAPRAARASQDRVKGS